MAAAAILWPLGDTRIARRLQPVRHAWGHGLLAGAALFDVKLNYINFIAIPITLGLMAWGTSKWDKMGPWDLGEGTFKLFAVLSVIAMILIFVLGIQPPNDWALWITVGFLVLTGIIWFGFESRRFQGPPIGDEVEKRRAVIAAAEKAVGETGH